MNVTKIGQCCLVIEVNGKRIMTDPGSYTTAQENERNIDAILITHEHGDHVHIPSLQNVLENNPHAKVYTNTSTGKLLDAENIAYEILEGSAATEFEGIALEACDGEHAEIFEEMGQVQNTGYLVAEELYYGGDSYQKPPKDVSILALPLGGPWCKLADSVRFAYDVAPKKAFPIHDAMITESGRNGLYKMAAGALAKKDIVFVALQEGERVEF